MNAVIRNSIIAGVLAVVGCATHRQLPLVGRWKVSGTDNVVMLMNDHSARLTSGGKTITGSYEGLAPDLLKLTFPAIAPKLEDRTISYHVPLDRRAGRSLTVFTDTASKLPPTAVLLDASGPAQLRSALGCVATVDTTLLKHDELETKDRSGGGRVAWHGCGVVLPAPTDKAFDGRKR